jgi:two-component system LytT family response regulator
MSNERIACLLVDDELLARLALRQALAGHHAVEIVGECGTADEAAEAIACLRPDLVFLDIRMPGMDSFALLERLQPDTLPLVVFATAFDAHAVKAFEAGAFDYVLKPVDQERFDRCMDRVVRQWRRLAADQRTQRQPVLGAAPVERLSVRVGEALRVVRVNDIDWIAADGNYVRLHAAGEVILHRQTLQQLHGQLDPARFLRIHRGTVVNLDRVREIHPLFHGDAEVVLRDGTRLPLSRRFRDGARGALGLR